MMTREQLEALGNQDLLGGQRMADLRGREIGKYLERLERDLNESDAQALLGEGRLEEEIERRLGVGQAVRI
jgi:hypothetical protein